MFISLAIGFFFLVDQKCYYFAQGQDIVKARELHIEIPKWCKDSDRVMQCFSLESSPEYLTNVLGLNVRKKPLPITQS